MAEKWEIYRFPIFPPFFGYFWRKCLFKLPKKMVEKWEIYNIDFPFSRHFLGIFGGNVYLNYPKNGGKMGNLYYRFPIFPPFFG